MLNINYQNILIKFALWLSTGFLIAIVGISNVFASEHDVGYFSNYTDVLLDVGGGAPVSLPINTYNVSGQVYQIYINVDNISINKDYIYQLELSTPASHLTNVNYILVNQIVNSGPNQTCNMLGYTDQSVGFPKVYFQCQSSFTSGSLTFTLYNINGSSLIDDYSHFKWGYTYLRYYDSSNDIDFGVVTQNATQNTQNIINNQNQNTQDIINSNKVCKTVNVSISSSNKDDYSIGYLQSNGTINSNSNFRYSDYISIRNGDTITISRTSRIGDGTSYCLYNTNKELISCSTYGSSLNVSINPTSDGYIRFTGGIENNTIVTVLSDYYCINGNQALDDSINDLNSSLTDSSPVDMGSLGNTAGWLPPGPIDSIINLPLNLFNNLLTALNGTCQPINIPLPYVNKNLPIPCISTIFNQITGLPTFWNWVGAITSVVILYRYLLALYKYYDDLTTLKANFISDFGGEP